ncbi:hypothetical protein [Rhizobium sp. MHM7A]|uniref:hypothetical protein n=1 Tax=Rhizobium sp. MHM7A TaxID=2583233 RepID=UPI0011071BAD|nr:hypothetical protein [Rhizobium sp. MHM7A]TLX16325.1 hypothetical protein FFR93_03065 [Rhizobium sp. MHM7A]
MHQQSIRVPIIFKAQVKNGNERKFREAWFGEWVDLAINTADSTEAPVAAEWMNKDISKLTPACVRVLGDQLYSPKKNRHGEDQANLSTFSSDDVKYGRAPVASAFANATLAMERMAFESFINGRMTTGTLADQKEYYGDTRTEALEKAQAIVGDLLVIDNLLWEKTNEPVLSLTGDNMHRDKHVAYEVEFPSGNWQSPGHKFRLTEWEAMIAFGELLIPATENGGNRWVFDKVTDLKIHIPQAFKAKVDLDAMVKLAAEVLKFSKDQVLDVGREATTFWHDVKDQLEETKSTRSNADLDLLKEVTERLILATDNDPSSRFRREIAAMSDRLENRIIERSQPALGR